MSLQNDDIGNSGYGSSDETASLLMVSTTNNVTIVSPQQRTITKMSSINGPTTSNTKPILTRQECTSSYLISPNLSQTLGGSEESGGPCDDERAAGQLHLTKAGANAATSVPDLDAQCHLEAPIISISNACRSGHRGSVSGYQLTPHQRCRTCRTCDRRASTTPVSSLQLARSVSKESVRSVIHGHLAPYSMTVQQHIPPVLITSSPNSGSRIIRQSSQPEASNIVCCSVHNCSHTAPSVSLRQLRDPSEGIAGIAADSLRINGAMRPFRQVSNTTLTNTKPNLLAIYVRIPITSVHIVSYQQQTNRILAKLTNCFQFISAATIRTTIRFEKSIFFILFIQILLPHSC